MKRKRRSLKVKPVTESLAPQLPESQPSTEKTDRFDAKEQLLRDGKNLTFVLTCILAVGMLVFHVLSVSTEDIVEGNDKQQATSPAAQEIEGNVQRQVTQQLNPVRVVETKLTQARPLPQQQPAIPKIAPLVVPEAPEPEEIQPPAPAALRTPTPAAVPTVAQKSEGTVSAETAQYRIQLLLSAAGNAVQAGNFPEAMSRYEKLVQLDPNNIDARIGYAYVLRQLGHSAQALEQYRTLLQSRPTDPTLLSSYSDALLGEGKIGEAYAVLLRAHQQLPDNIKIAVKLAKIYVIEGLRGQARQLATRYLRAGLGLNPDLKLEAAELFLMLDDPISAEPYLSIVLAASQPNSRDTAALVRYFALLSDCRRTRIYVNRYLQLVVAAAPIAELADFLLYTGHVKIAREMVSHALLRYPSNRDLLLCAARVALQNYETAEAEIFLSNVPLQQQNRDHFLLLARACELDGRWVTAKKMLSSYLESVPFDLEAKMLLAQVLRDQEEYIKADHLLAQIADEYTRNWRSIGCTPTFVSLTNPRCNQQPPHQRYTATPGLTPMAGGAPMLIEDSRRACEVGAFRPAPALCRPAPNAAFDIAASVAPPVGVLGRNPLPGVPSGPCLSGPCGPGSCGSACGTANNAVLWNQVVENGNTRKIVEKLDPKELMLAGRLAEYRLAESLFIQRRYEESLIVCNNFRKANPHDLDALILWTKCMVKLECFGEATYALESYLANNKIAPAKRTPVLAVLGYAYFESGCALNAALKTLTAAINGASDEDGFARYTLYRAMRTTGSDFCTVEPELREGIMQSDIPIDFLLTIIDEAVSQGDLEVVQAMTDEAKRIAPMNVAVRIRSGEYCLTLGDKGAALAANKCFEEVLYHQPDNQRAMLGNAAALAASQCPQQSLAVYEQLQRDDPWNLQIALRKGRIALALPERKDAVSRYDNAIAQRQSACTTNPWAVLHGVNSTPTHCTDNILALPPAVNRQYGTPGSLAPKPEEKNNSAAPAKEASRSVWDVFFFRGNNNSVKTENGTTRGNNNGYYLTPTQPQYAQPRPAGNVAAPRYGAAPQVLRQPEVISTPQPRTQAPLQVSPQKQQYAPAGVNSGANNQLQRAMQQAPKSYGSRDKQFPTPAVGLSNLGNYSNTLRQEDTVSPALPTYATRNWALRVPYRPAPPSPEVLAAELRQLEIERNAAACAQTHPTQARTYYEELAHVAPYESYYPYQAATLQDATGGTYFSNYYLYESLVIDPTSRNTLLALGANTKNVKRHSDLSYFLWDEQGYGGFAQHTEHRFSFATYWPHLNKDEYFGLNYTGIINYFRGDNPNDLANARIQAANAQLPAGSTPTPLVTAPFLESVGGHAIGIRYQKRLNYLGNSPWYNGFLPWVNSPLFFAHYDVEMYDSGFVTAKPVGRVGLEFRSSRDSIVQVGFHSENYLKNYECAVQNIAYGGFFVNSSFRPVNNLWLRANYQYNCFNDGNRQGAFDLLTQLTLIKKQYSEFGLLANYGHWTFAEGDTYPPYTYDASGVGTMRLDLSDHPYWAPSNYNYVDFGIHCAFDFNDSPYFGAPQRRIMFEYKNRWDNQNERFSIYRVSGIWDHCESLRSILQFDLTDSTVYTSPSLFYTLQIIPH